MDNSTNKTNAVSELHVFSRKRATFTGVEKVIASCETSLNLITACGNLTVSGEKLKIIKFDSDSGMLEFEGNINSLKYSGERQPLIKRIFK